MALRRVIPSMFHRRLLLLLTLGALGGAALVAQAVRLTVVEGDVWLDAAEQRLVAERWTPTTRGRILDRHGRVLAEERPAFDLMVDYEVITGGWAESEAWTRAWQEHRTEWRQLGAAERQRRMEARLPALEAELDRMWNELAAALGTTRSDLESRKDEIKRSVQRMAEHVWGRRLEQRLEELRDRGAHETTVDLGEVAAPIREQRIAHRLAKGLDAERAFAIRGLAGRSPGLALEPSSSRAYPFETVLVNVDLATLPPPLAEDRVQPSDVRGAATSLVGWLRPLDSVAEGEPLDTDRRPLRDPETGAVDRGHYRPGDLVGGHGAEAFAENRLRGLRGHEIRRLDTGERTTASRVPGTDVHLTIDILLQARIAAIMQPELGLAQVQPWHHPRAAYPVPDGTALHGAVVVVDVESGELLALVSTPGFRRADLAERPEWVFGDPVDVPFANRAFGRPYAPGSIVKPIVLAAAVTDGAHRLSDPIACTGHLLPNEPEKLRCWIYKQYGQTHVGATGGGLLAPHALAVSCNIYFYTLGRELGVERLVRWYERFGVGAAPTIGAGHAFAGVVGRKLSGEPLYTSDAVLMAIGQGPIAWTPLHAADAYATIARGGVRLAPRLDRDAAPAGEHLRLDPASVDAALAGLHGSLHDPWGTGHAIRYEDGTVDRIVDVPGVRMIGKTGTATANPVVHDPDGPEGPEPPRVLREGDHAWFVGLVGPEGAAARYAVAVLVEYGGSGGRVAGPIAEQTVHALVAEGYL